MSSDILIAANNVTKVFRMYEGRSHRILHALGLKKNAAHHEFVAVNNVSCEIRRGEAVGIVGPNGSGKSTLLQIICGIRKPTAGSIEVNGRIMALLELGGGFNPEFTGRENVFFQGAIMGISRSEMERRFDDVAAFADIGEFMEQPVRMYSSGMFVRLAFSVAVSSDPDILIIDEALSVGDMVFNHKSRKRIRQLRESGTSLLIVSHDRSTITAMCNRAILLDKGAVAKDGTAPEVMDYYHAAMASKAGQQIHQTLSGTGQVQTFSGTGEAVVESMKLVGQDGRELDEISPGQQVALEFHVKVNQPIPCLVFGFIIRDEFGQSVYGINTNSFDRSLLDVAPGDKYFLRFAFAANIGVGTYSVSTALVSTNDHLTNNYESRDLAFFFSVRNESGKPFAGVAWLNPELEIDQC